MRVVVDTNVLVSALLVRGSPPALVVEEWLADHFALVTHELQFAELAAVCRRERLRARLRHAELGRLVNQLRALATVPDRLPDVRRSADPADNFLLALCEVAHADYLMTGDKADLLALARHGGTQIVTARQFIDRWKGAFGLLQVRRE